MALHVVIPDVSSAPDLPAPSPGLPHFSWHTTTTHSYLKSDYNVDIDCTSNTLDPSSGYHERLAKRRRSSSVAAEDVLQLIKRSRLDSDGDNPCGALTSACNIDGIDILHDSPPINELNDSEVMSALVALVPDIHSVLHTDDEMLTASSPGSFISDTMSCCDVLETPSNSSSHFSFDPALRLSGVASRHTVHINTDDSDYHSHTSDDDCDALRVPQGPGICSVAAKKKTYVKKTKGDAGRERRVYSRSHEFLEVLKRLLEERSPCLAPYPLSGAFYVRDANRLCEVWHNHRGLPLKRDGNAIHALFRYYTKSGKISMEKLKVGKRNRNVYKFIE